MRARPALEAASRSLARAHVTLLAIAWFGAALAVTLWVWGPNPLVFLGDEAVNRMAAELIREIGRPIADVPVADPEDLLHMHEWMTLGEHAFPIYPPVTFYLYGFLLKAGVVGQLVIAALPASAMAAFFRGTAELLPKDRRWLAIPAPVLAIPATYWLLRPWANLSLMLTCVCWSFFWWARWRTRPSNGYLAAALFFAGAAASVRPDYAAHLLSAAMFFSLAAEPRRYRLILGLVLASGLCAVGLNLLLNRAVSGTSFRPIYELVLNRDHSVESAGSLGLLLRLWFPLGVPSAGNVLHFIEKYWVEMGQLKWLLAAQLALVPLFLRMSWLSRAFAALGLLVLLLILISHVDTDLFGAPDPEPYVFHSIPRYWTPVYLLAAIPPTLLFGTIRFRPALWGFVALAGLLSYSTVNGVFKTEEMPFPQLRQMVKEGPRLLDDLAKYIPKEAVVYSVSRHGTLWPRFRMGLIGGVQPTAASMIRCKRAGLPVFVYGPRFHGLRRPLARLLRKQGLKVVLVSRPLQIYQVR